MRLDHVAHSCRDAAATHRFYSAVMGLQLAQAYAGGELLLVYELPGGGSLAFTASPNALSEEIPRAEWERRHIGLTVADRAEFEEWLARLKTHAIAYQLFDNERIYIADPNGVVIEIEVEEPAAPNPQASEVLQRWLADRH